MDKLAEKLQQLTAIKGHTTAHYLANTRLDELRAKLKEVNVISEDFVREWDKINPEDLTDAESLGFEGKKDEMTELRDSIKGPLESRIATLEADWARSERHAQQGTSGGQPNPSIAELNTMYTRLQARQEEYTPNYLEMTLETTLEEKQRELDQVHGQYLVKYLELDTSGLDEAEKTRLKKQRADVTELVQTLDNLLEKAADKKAAESSLRRVEEHRAARERAEREANEAIERARAEKEAKEAASNVSEKEIAELRAAKDKAERELQAAINQAAEQEELRRAKERAEKELEGAIKKAAQDLAAAREKADQELAAAEERADRELEAANQRAAQQEEYRKAKDVAERELEAIRLDGAKATQDCKDEKNHFTREIDRLNKLAAELRTGAEREKREAEQAIKEITNKLQHERERREEKGEIARAKTQPQPGPSTGNLPVLGEGGSDDEYDVPLGSRFDGGDAVIGAPKKRDDVPATIQLKLDTIRIPFFSGDLTEWNTFKEMFTYLIDGNSSMADALKLHQLKQHLRGTAYDTIRGYQITGSNYQAAWADLKRRYDRKDDTIQDYIRKFLEIPSITHRANFTRLRAIVDGTNQMLRALPNLGIEVESWDPFVGLIISMKLDDETRSEWKQRLGRGETTRVRDLLEFLEVRAIELQPTQGDKLSQLLRGDHHRKQHGRIFHVEETHPETGASKTTCPVCKGPHSIWKCPKIRAECARVRTDIVRDLKLCFKCFLKHEIGMCTKRNCPYCDGAHNMLLCYKLENNKGGHHGGQADHGHARDHQGKGRNQPKRGRNSYNQGGRNQRESGARGPPPPTNNTQLNEEEDWDTDWNRPQTSKN